MSTGQARKFDSVPGFFRGPRLCQHDAPTEGYNTHKTDCARPDRRWERNQHYFVETRSEDECRVFDGEVSEVRQQEVITTVVEIKQECQSTQGKRRALVPARHFKTTDIGEDPNPGMRRSHRN